MKPSLDWSRSLAVGEFSEGSIGVAVTDGLTHLVWPFDAEGAVHLRYVQLDESANLITDSDLALVGQLRSPRIIPAAEGRLHLFWSSREAGMPGWDLRHDLLLPDGRLAGQAFRVSAEDFNVGDYAIASDVEGGVYVAWGGWREGDIFLQHLDSSGEPLTPPISVTDNGNSPHVRIGADGTVHVAWLEGQDIYYAALPADLSGSPQGTLVSNLSMGTGDSLFGPVVGLSDGYVYVFWSILSRSGMAAGTAHTDFVSFPMGNPREINSGQVWILPDEEQPYRAVENSFALTQLAPPVEIPTFTTDFILHPSTLPGERDELAVVLAANQSMRRSTQLQIVVALFEAGEFKGYSYASKTQQISDDPVIAIDEDGHFHLAWREGAYGRKVYYASNDPDARAKLDRLTSGDVLNAFLQGGIESLATVALLPVVGFGWLMPGFLLIGLFKLFREHENVSDPVSWIPLLLGIGLYQFIKYVTLPTMTSYVPFSAWIELPAAWGDPLRYGVPILIFGLALAAGYYVQKRYTSSILAFYLTVGLFDAIFSLAIYGVNFLGVGIV